MKPETYYCRGFLFSANLPTEYLNSRHHRYPGSHMLGFNPCKSLLLYGTHGIRNAVLPLRFNPVPMNFDCCAGRNRTSDLQLMRLTSYQLLYRAMSFSILIYKNYAKVANFCKKVSYYW